MYSSFIVKEIRSSDKKMKPEELQQILILSNEEAALLIETQNPVFMGQKITIFVETNDEKVKSSNEFSLSVEFATELPVFDLSDLEVQPMTCTETDKGWTMVLPEIKNPMDLQYEVSM